MYGMAAGSTVTGSCTSGSLGGGGDAAGFAAAVVIIGQGVEVDDGEQWLGGHGASLTAALASR